MNYPLPTRLFFGMLVSAATAWLTADVALAEPLDAAEATQLARLDASSQSILLEPVFAEAGASLAMSDRTFSVDELAWRQAAAIEQPAAAPVFAKQGFGLPEELLRQDARSFETAFYTSLLAMLLFAIAIALRQLFYESLNRGMERIVIRLHGGERTTHRRRRRPSSSAKYATLSQYLNEGGAGRRRRRSRSRPASRHADPGNGAAWQPSAEAVRPRGRDQIVDAVVLTNGVLADGHLLGCAS